MPLLGRNDSMLHAEGVHCEWLRTLEAVRALEWAQADLAEPPGFGL